MIPAVPVERVGAEAARIDIADADRYVARKVQFRLRRCRIKRRKRRDALLESLT